MYQNYVIKNIGRQAHLEVASIYFTVKLSCAYANDANTSVISSSALPPPENCEAFAHIVHLSRWGIHNSIAARGLGISVPQGGPWAFDTHVFESAMEEFISKDQAFIED